jgi:hypothetical protein
MKQSKYKRYPLLKAPRDLSGAGANSANYPINSRYAPQVCQPGRPKTKVFPLNFNTSDYDLMDKSKDMD